MAIGQSRNSVMTLTTNCRLCGADLNPSFNLRLLDAHDVDFFRCRSCGSLQSEEPYWLDEAYKVSLSRLDTGAAQRNMISLAATFTIAKLFGVVDVIDRGGGDGLLCRLLRDYGINCFVTDKFASATYAQGFTTPNFQRPEMVIAFEVIEHFARPAEDLSTIFESGARVVLLTTGIYEGQSSNWWYLAPETGQHIFFYSMDALRLIAKRYDFSFARIGRFCLFFKGESSWRLFFASILLRRFGIPFVRAAIQLLPAPGVGKDMQSQKAR
jgi:hypothetical protein